MASHYCSPFTVLATLCNDMPGMRGCEDYKALCRTPGSVVAQCSAQPAVPGYGCCMQTGTVPCGCCAT